MDEFKKEEKVTFLVKYHEKADVNKVATEAKKKASKAKLSSQKADLLQRSAVISELKSIAFDSQKNVIEFLEKEQKNGSVKDFHSYHIVNGMAVTATKEIAEKLAHFPEVEKILPNETRKLLETETLKKPDKKLADEVEWNVERVGAPDTWGLGIDGSGAVVASLDTGVQWDHPALKEQYRGFDGENVEHQYSWYDPSGGQSAPVDDHGHGSHVTGTMVGAEPDGSNQVGVAPGAKWIAAKVFNAAGSTTDAILLDAAEWMLAPGGRADMAPDVVNNSWGGGPGIDEWYMDAVDAWRAANIFPAFAAGNVDLFNPGGPGSVVTPANYPQSFAVGNTKNDDIISSSSLRGPSPYGEIKPDVSAPGTGIRSSVPGGSYGGMSGTSMATPAVSGVVALLRSVNASLTVDDIEEILMNTAEARTDNEYPESPNNGYGYGIVNAYDAVSSIMDGLGKIEGQVTRDGEDDEAPTYEHTAPSETYAGMDLDLIAQVSDNISVTSVHVSYQINNGEWKTVEANRISGNYKNGEYRATIPGEDITEGTLVYKWVILDFGNNEVTSDTYEVVVAAGITTGYFEDFETTPTGWTTFGQNNSWEWGVPTSGPRSAASGEKVYATNLDGNYDNNMNATLLMPPIDLPEGNAYLQFDHWHNFEMYSSGTAYDYGYVVVSTNMENWTQLKIVKGESDGWEPAEVDLSEYAGQRIYIGFNATSDSSVAREGWYIDNVGLSDESNGADYALLKDKQLGLVGSKKAQKGKVDKNEPIKPAVDPTKNKPVMPKAKKKTIKRSHNPMALPMGAKVSVLESGRSVNTNPQDGSYSFVHNAGDFTLKAEAYGFRTVEQPVTVERDRTVTANFMLEELPQATISGTVIDANTKEPVEGATILLVEDANIEPAQTDADGKYSLTAYEGNYTLKIMAKGFKGKEVELNLDGDQELEIELEPFYTVPGGEIGYDDGTPENARVFYDAGNGWAVKMSLPEGKEKAIVTDGVFRFWDTEWPVPGGTEFAVEVWDASGKDGLPGKKLAGPIEAEALRNGEWTVVDLNEYNIEVEGDFYMVYIQTHPNPNAPGLATDESSPNAERSYQLVGGSWSQSPANEGNYMIRARVAYGVDDPVITSPTEDVITNEANLTVEGTASPTTTIQLLNNGEEVGSSEVGDDGKFSFDIELDEGANEFKAVSILRGANVGESAPVTVTLDTQSPELTIENPKNGDKTNRETITVEGTVADANLDFVKVNGQKAAVEDGKYSKRILLDNGENEIEVVAQDLAGNTTTKSVTIDVKYTAPKIENLTPDEDKTLSAGDSVKVEFDSEPGLRATFSIHMPLTNVQNANATELPLMETTPGHYVGYYTATNNVKVDGAKIEVKVRDAYGNETRKVADGTLFINVNN